MTNIKKWVTFTLANYMYNISKNMPTPDSGQIQGDSSKTPSSIGLVRDTLPVSSRITTRTPRRSNTVASTTPRYFEGATPKKAVF